MEIDTRGLPDSQPAEEETSKNQVDPILKEDQQPKEEANAELEALKIKNLELQKQKEHWREKYERDINKPAPSVENLDEDTFSDEGKFLKSEISSLKQELTQIKQVEEERQVYSKYPQLKDKQEEFKEFLEDPENSGLSREKAAKLFLLDKGLIGETPQRKGLEKPTGGQKSGIQSGISVDDVKRLRETQPRKYVEMLRKGVIKPEDIQ